MSSESSGLQCCCGRSDCAYLKHNDTAMGGLERDLDTAARLGQALLSRHESYITESQAEHARMSAYISELESERISLQNANEKMVAENRGLLSQLEALNTSLATSDSEVKRLEELLLDCELELKRLNGLVRRTEHLDDKVHEMEHERMVLNRRITEGRDEVRGTLARWRESERKVRELEEDVRRIEVEARAEREKHEELIARMERERALERELGGAEGRLKGAAALQGMKSNAPGAKSVVSHFVRDILQDNANLQAGIAELRELLDSSNEEVQNLREQILLHQPVTDDTEREGYNRSVSLSDELAQVQPSPKQLQQEVHVHHHYHAKLAKKEKQLSAKRPGRKRAVMPTYGYASDISSPSTPLSRPQRFTTSPVVPLSLQHPQPRASNRWSMHSNTTQSSVFSSMPSSPRSYFDRNGSLFDRMEQGEESSRPTSPESVADFYSPSWKQPSKADDIGLGVFEEEEESSCSENLSPLAHQIIEEEAVLETGTDLTQPEKEHSLTPKPSITIHTSPDEDTTPKAPDRISTGTSKLRTEDMPPIKSPLDNIPEIRPSIARRASHESLVSISGMDIHLAQRPSPATTLQLLQGNSAHFALSPSKPRMLSAAAPKATVTEYTVVSSNFEALSPSSRTLRRIPSGVEALSGIAVPAPRVRSTKASPSSNGGISRLVGGWVRGKWGIAPMKSASNLRSASAGEHNSNVISEASDELSSSSSVRTSSTVEAPMASQALDPTINTVSKQDPTSSNDAKPSTPAKRSELITTTLPTVHESSPPKPILNAATKQPAAMNESSYMDANSFFMGRSPGVNQPGFIPGFRSVVLGRPTPSDVIGRIIDEEALKEGLCE